MKKDQLVLFNSLIKPIIEVDKEQQLQESNNTKDEKPVDL